MKKTIALLALFLSLNAHSMSTTDCTTDYNGDVHCETFDWD